MSPVARHPACLLQVPNGAAVVGFQWGQQDLSVDSNGNGSSAAPSSNGNGNGNGSGAHIEHQQVHRLLRCYFVAMHVHTLSCRAWGHVCILAKLNVGASCSAVVHEAVHAEYWLGTLVDCDGAWLHSAQQADKQWSITNTHPSAAVTLAALPS